MPHRLTRVNVSNIRPKIAEKKTELVLDQNIYIELTLGQMIMTKLA